MTRTKSKGSPPARILQRAPMTSSVAPNFVTVGHVTRDLQGGGPAWRPGGSVSYAASTAARLGRWEFLLVAAPIPNPGGTGSPLNPLAIF